MSLGGFGRGVPLGDPPSVESQNRGNEKSGRKPGGKGRSNDQGGRRNGPGGERKPDSRFRGFDQGERFGAQHYEHEPMADGSRGDYRRHDTHWPEKPNVRVVKFESVPGCGMAQGDPGHRCGERCHTNQRGENRADERSFHAFGRDANHGGNDRKNRASRQEGEKPRRHQDDRNQGRRESNRMEFGNNGDHRGFDHGQYQRGSGMHNRKCFNCGEEGHQIRECTKPKQGGSEQSFRTPEHMWPIPDVSKPPPPLDLQISQPGIRGNTDSFQGDMTQKKRPGPCYKCGIEGHKARDCTEPGDAWQNKRVGQNAPDSSASFFDAGQALTLASPPAMITSGFHHGHSGDSGQRVPGDVSLQQRPRKSVTCYNCKQDGHFSRDCPEKMKENVVECYNCKQQGHFSRDCPEKTKESDAEKRKSFHWVPNREDDRSLNTGPADLSREPTVLVLAAAAVSERADAGFWQQASDAQGNSPPNFGSQTDLASIAIADGTEALEETKHFSLIKHDVVLVDQLAKKQELEKKILGGKENYKEDAGCKCALFSKCVCRKRMVVFVKQRMTMEAIKVRMSMLHVPTAIVHNEMDQNERNRVLARFKNGRDHILLLMESEISKVSDIWGEVDWMVNLCLPPTIDEYNKRVEMARRDGKELVVTSFYDTLMDQSMVGALVQVLKDAGEAIPEWLEQQVMASQMDLDEGDETDVMEE